MAAEVLAGSGAQVDLFDAMPSVGRKFLLAGKGGLNLTHSEPSEAFLDRYGPRRDVLEPMLRRFGPAELRFWAQGLGITTFVGSSGRIFPTDLKAAPLLRAWLARLRAAGVTFHMRHRWTGWTEADVGQAGPPSVLRFTTPAGEVLWPTDAAVLALGGASWPQLGSDGSWVSLLEARSVSVAPLLPSNCGFDIVREGMGGVPAGGWSDFFRARHAGHPLKNVALSLMTSAGACFERQGEFVVTAAGIEGSLVYALSALARDEIASHGCAVVHVDLLPGRSHAFVDAELARPRGSRSLATHLKSRLGIDGVKASLLHELLPRDEIADPLRLAAALKALPLTLHAARPIAEAISSAGGVCLDAKTSGVLLERCGVACAGEMLDWEAPTGGYLLNACMASGRSAAEVVISWLSKE